MKSDTIDYYFHFAYELVPLWLFFPSDRNMNCISVFFSSLFVHLKMEKKRQENKMCRDQLNDEYLELLDKQRLYFKTVKNFKEVNAHTSS